MKKRILKIASYIAYLMAILLVITFVVFLVLSWLHRKEMLLNPLVELVPFYFTVKRWVLVFLIPSGIFVVLGWILHKFSQ